MPDPSAFRSQALPEPHASIAGRFTADNNFTSQAKKYRPKDATLEPPAATVARHSARLLDLETGEAYSADEFISHILDAGFVPSVNQIPKWIYPRFGDLNFFGDSQAKGTNSSGRPYTSEGLLKAAHRYADIVFAAAQLDTLNNHAVPGSRLSWKAGAENSSFNQMGLLGFEDPVIGIIALNVGWNNLAQGGAPWTPDAQRFFMNAQMAHIARGLVDDWGGITQFGWTRSSSGFTDSSPTPGWATTGAHSNSAAADYMPFQCAPGDVARYRIGLDANEYVEFDVDEGIRAVGLFFETTSAGGAFQVLVNGVVVGEFSSLYDAPLGDSFPGVVWLDNVAEGDTIRFRGVSGVQQWLAFGTVADTADVYKKLILCASPTGNPANGRTSEYLQGSFAATKEAVSVFTQNYPVLFVDTQTNWVTARDQEPSDISHITDLGNAQIASQFLQAYQPTSGTNSYFIRL